MVELPVFASRRLCRPGSLISYEIVTGNSSGPRAAGGEDTVNMKESSAVQPVFSRSTCWYNTSCSLTWPDSKKNQRLVWGIIRELTYILIGGDTCLFRVYSTPPQTSAHFHANSGTLKVGLLVKPKWFYYQNDLLIREKKVHWFWDD